MKIMLNEEKCINNTRCHTIKKRRNIIDRNTQRLAYCITIMSVSNIRQIVTNISYSMLNLYSRSLM